jgi:diguanylate cyclase (GGDEF)-like protein/PAS domain S-box-containing protein
MSDGSEYKNKTQEELVKELVTLRGRISENERKLRAIFDQTYQFIGLMTPDGVLIEANKTALDFIGADASKVLGKLFWETAWWTHSPEQQEKLRQAVNKAAAGEFVRFEATHPAQDGSLHYIDFSLKPVKDESGKIAYLIPEGRDITERKSAEDAFRGGLEQYRALIETTNTGYVIIDEKGRVIGANAEYLRLTGYNNLDEIRGKNVIAWTADYEKEKNKEAIEKCAREGKIRNLEIDYVDSHGKITPIEINATVVETAGKRQILTLCRDITKRRTMEERLKETQAELEIRVKVRTAELTKSNDDLLREVKERKRVENLLKESESRYRAIIEDQTELICRFSPNGIVLFANDAYCRYFRKNPEEIIGKVFRPRILEEDRKKVEEGIKSLTKETPIIYQECRIIDENHIIRWTHWSMHALFDEDNQLIGYQLVGRDITEQKQAGQELQEKERFLSSIFSSIQDGLSILDKDMNIIRVNSVMEKWYAHNLPLVGKKCYQAYHCAKVPCKVCPTRQTLLNGKSAVEVVPFRGPEAKIRGWLELFSFPLFDQETGELKGAIEYVRDISERKIAEEEKEKLNRELAISNRRLKQIALMDPLTGLYNRRYLDKVIEAEFHRAKRYVHPLAVIMVDLDYFKSINDVYGFAFGDSVLKQFALQLKHLVRKYDVVVRFGGEEFLVLSPGIARPEALALSQRLLDTLTMYNFGDKKHKVKLKVSFSVASYPEDRIGKGMDLIDLADKLLNKVKDSGGNKVYSSLDLIKEKASESSKKVDINALKGKLDKLTKKTNQNLAEAIFAFAKTIELKDHYTGEHVENTVKYATELAKALNLSKEETELVKQASMLHDLGKVGISENILLKKSKLTKKEYEEIKKHPQIGADIIRPIQYLREIIPFIFYHHERWDGKGYPSGIKGEEIPVGARIIALADVYQALTSDRPYRKAYSKKKAIEIIEEGAGTQFDPTIVDIFLKILSKEKP